MRQLKKVYNPYSYTKVRLTFEDEVGGQESQTIALKKRPSDEWIRLFMEEQSFTKVTIREDETNVETFGFDIPERMYEE